MDSLTAELTTADPVGSAATLVSTEEAEPDWATAICMIILIKPLCYLGIETDLR